MNEKKYHVLKNNAPENLSKGINWLISNLQYYEENKLPVEMSVVDTMMELFGIDHYVVNHEGKDITVTDEWYPCFPGNKIHVCLHSGYGSEENIYIGAYGDDDFGMYLIFDGINDESYCKAKAIYDSIPDVGASKEWFYEHGFRVD